LQLLSAQQIHEWDAFTILHEPITSVDLMERAAERCVDWLTNNNFIHQKIKIFCGKGNNGGDGLAIARMLLEKGFAVTVYILEFGAIGTEDFQTNLHRLHAVTTNIHFIQSAEFIPFIETNDIVIDALYGSGLNRPLQSLSKEIVEHINYSSATVVAIDVPSGLSIDSSSKQHTVIQANHTLTFQSLKLCFLMAENAAYFGKVEVLNIGLHPDFLQMIDSPFEMVEPQFISTQIKHRNQFSHKGHFGHALLIGGNEGKMGAALLSAKACLRSGVGLVTVNIPQQSQTTINTFLPEAMTINRFDKIAFSNYSTIAIGPGLGMDASAQQLLTHVLQQYKQPMVIDADALNIISADKNLASLISPNSILTPHPKELERWVGICENDFDRMHKAIALSQQLNGIVILKGHYTLIAANGKGYFNTTGNAGLAKGGSGDVLTGMITALLAQKYSPLNAAIIAVYLHGLAADLALENQSTESLLATDVIDTIGKAFNYVLD
jgi:NAD(P)H-hydrate epimerase